MALLKVFFTDNGVVAVLAQARIVLGKKSSSGAVL